MKLELSIKLAPIEVWCVERGYTMHRKLGDCWVQYRDPIDMMDCPSNMEIGLRGYQQGTNNNRLMILCRLRCLLVCRVFLNFFIYI